MNNKTAREIRKITKRIPEKLMSGLMVEKPMASTVIEVAKRAIKDPEVKQETKDRMQNILDSGLLNQTEMAVDHEVEAKIDKWMEKEIDKAISEGRIPDPKTDKDMQEYRKKVKKVIKWKNKNT